MSTDREFRNSAGRGGFPFQDTPSNFAKIPPGQYGKHVTVHDDGSVTIAALAYADDVVAFVLGTIRGHPGISDSTKRLLGKFLDEMDARAVSIHGYSDEPEEAAYQWRPVGN